MTDKNTYGTPEDRVLYSTTRDIFLSYTDPFERLEIAPPQPAPPEDPAVGDQ